MSQNSAHLHVLVPDDVWVRGPDDTPTFVAVAPPTDDDIQHLVQRTAQRVRRLLQRRGLLQDEPPDSLAQDQPLLAALTAAAVQGTVTTGARAGAPLLRRLGRPPRPRQGAPLCAAQDGFSLHAATRVPAHDRHRLELLCRWVLRPPLSAARLRWLDPQTLVFSLRTPWRDGTCELLVSPNEFLEKLAALVPPPHLHLVRYHGVLAAHAADRQHLVPKGPAQDQPEPDGTPPRTCRHSRQQLLARAFQIELTCPRCAGPLRVLATLTDPHSIRTYLEGVGLDSRPLASLTTRRTRQRPPAPSTAPTRSSAPCPSAPC